MARYKDPEERLEDIEKTVNHIAHTVDSMQRRAMIITILRLLRLAALAAVILWVYHGLQPFVEQLGTASIQMQENVENFNNSVDSVKSFFGVDSTEQ